MLTFNFFGFLWGVDGYHIDILKIFVVSRARTVDRPTGKVACQGSAQRVLQARSPRWLKEALARFITMYADEDEDT